MTYKATEINTVCVIGFGTMGIGIAQNFAEAGLTVNVIDMNQDAITRGLAQVKSNLSVASEVGFAGNIDEICSNIAGYTWEQFDAATSGIELVVETVPEVLEIKMDTFAALDKLDQKILIGSNTSSFTVSQMTENIQTAHRVVGLHYFNPAHLIPAVEIHHGSRTTENAIDEMIKIMKRVGKAPIRVRKEIPGFIINRLTGALEREIDLLLDQGVVTPEDLDVAVKASLGFRLACLGPMEAEDFIGLDTAYRVSNNVFKGLSNATKASDELGEKVERGELGVKAGKGWYDYSGQTNEEIFAKRDLKLLRQLSVYQNNQAAEKE